jgi:hypothetical protein
MFEYIGRIDHQVKINGFRVEPGEVEAHLNARPGIRDSVVVARTGTGGHPCLAAFWIGQEGGDADIGADALRAWLSDLVPEYMIPARFERLADFPLTPNRKIDRRALAVESFADLLDRHGVRDHRAAPPATASRPDGTICHRRSRPDCGTSWPTCSGSSRTASRSTARSASSASIRSASPGWRWN